MDIEAFLCDAELVLNMLPPDFVHKVVGSIVQNIPVLAEKWPVIVKMMRPHLMAGMVAHTAGVLDEAEINKAVMALFQRYFAAHPPQG